MGISDTKKLLYSCLTFLILFQGVFACRLFAQDPEETERFLNSMNKQVAFMNLTDDELMPIFQDLSGINQQLVRFLDEDPNLRLSYACSFEAPEGRYKQAVYQKLNIPAEFRGEILDRMERLMEHIREIARICNSLETYIQNADYKNDKGLEGFIMLKQMDKRLRQYLVAHEAWHAALTTSWSTYYMQRQGKRSPIVVIRMERALSTAHVVYLDLGYDPDFTDSKKHFSELNDNLIKLRIMYERDSVIHGNEAFNEFTEKFDAKYLDGLGAKGTLAFFRKFNETYVRDVNRRLIDNFNRFVNGENYLVLNASRLPPFFVFKKPETDLEQLAEEVKKEKFEKEKPPVVKNETKDPVPDPKLAEKPGEPEKKTSALEGYAPNNLVFLIDVSASMEQGGRLDTLKSSFRHLLAEMRPKDKVSIVTYSGNARVMLFPTSASESRKILSVVNSLRSEGKSNVDQGFLLGYQAAKNGFVPEGNNRVILITDGFIKYNGNSTEMIRSNATENVSLSVFFFGNEANPYLDMSSLYRLSEIGKGNFITVLRSNAKESMIKEAQAVKSLDE
jgi:Ca-activated chloride channel family protein